MSAGLTLLESLDRLYEQAVTDPDACDDAALASAAADVLNSLSEPPPREVVRAFNVGLRRARRLRTYWADRDVDLPDWRMGVDEALGTQGWQPGLDLAKAALEAEPLPELFEEVKVRFRRVHFQPWPEGSSYEEWVSGQS